jgi:hypothetical protein
VYFLIFSFLLLGFFALLTLGLLSVLKDLVERYCECEPIFSEQGAISSDHDSDQQQLRS